MQAGKATASGVQWGLCFVAATRSAAGLRSSAYLHMQATDYPWKQTFHQEATKNQSSSYAKTLGQV